MFLLALALAMGICTMVVVVVQGALVMVTLPSGVSEADDVT